MQSRPQTFRLSVFHTSSLQLALLTIRDKVKYWLLNGGIRLMSNFVVHCGNNKQDYMHNEFLFTTISIYNYIIFSICMGGRGARWSLWRDLGKPLFRAPLLNCPLAPECLDFHDKNNLF